MIKLKTTTILVALTLNCFILSSQISIDTTILSINDSSRNYYLIKKDVNLTTEQFLLNIHSLCKLSSNNKLTSISNRIDSLGQKHEKFIHSINGVPIEYSKVIFHSDKNSRLKRQKPD